MQTSNAENSKQAKALSPQRRFVYFKSGGERLAGWVHSAAPEMPCQRIAVICNPLGVEYMSGYRSVRHLADELALAGIAALRFDYASTGDSSGGQLSDRRIEDFSADIKAAVEAMVAQFSASSVCLLGIGLGATFAALAGAQYGADELILWNPTVNGRRFVREQMLLSEMLRQQGDESAEEIDAAGINLTPNFQAEFSGIDLTALDYSKVGKVLLAHRTDMKAPGKLLKALDKQGVEFSSVSLPGYLKMMDNPTDTVVPGEAISHIVTWAGRSATSGGPGNGRDKTSFGDDQLQMRVAEELLVETPLHFGDHQQLFGILTRNTTAKPGSNQERAYVFLNCGSEHHSGPHRIYTKLARIAAARGFTALRFDLEGIGDSITIGNNEENNSYSPVAMDDLDAALNLLRQQFGCKDFVLSGICAGAYHSFKGIASLDHHPISAAVIINPLVYEWDYENPENHLRYEIHTYGPAIRDPDRWKRFMRGQVNYKRLVAATSRVVFERIRRLGKRLISCLPGGEISGLPADMRAIRSLDRRIIMILSENDPGLALMRLQAARETSAARRSGMLEVHHIPGANHGLSKKSMQEALIRIFEDNAW